MPSWKKVITSGSNAALNSLTVTNGITGSLFGTASWAVSASNAVTASYALTSSYSFNPTISGSISQVDYIDFNTGSATPAWKSGRVFWDNTEQSLAVYNSEADVTLNVGQENWTRVWNASGGTISNGTPVRISGTHGDVPQVVLAQSVAVSGSANLINQVLGVATHDIEVNTFGFITTQGLVHGLNTNAYNDGDTLYVSTTAGVLTNTQPPAPFEIIPVGQVVKASPGGSGIIYCAVQQPIDFSDLSSVRRTGIDYAVGDLWTYVTSGSTNVWVHGKQLSGSYGVTGSINAIGGFTGSLFGTSSWAASASNAVNAQTASFVTASNVYGPFGSNSITSASFAVSSSRTVTASFALTASGIGPAILSNSNNNVLTATGGSTIQGESNLIFDGNTLQVRGSVIQGSSNNTITGGQAHAEGGDTAANGDYSHAEGRFTLAQGNSAHSEGNYTTASGNYSHAEGFSTVASGDYSHAEGNSTVASGLYQSVVGQYNISSSAPSAFILGNGTANGSRSNLVFASGSQVQITGSFNVNGNVLITGSATIGSSSLGASENTLTLGPSPAGGTGEGGQLGLNAVGGIYTSASFIDNYQNQVRILKGTNASSTGLVAQWNLQTLQMQLPAYNSPTAQPGTVSGLLAFDTSGNIITTTTGSGGGGVTINNNVDNYIVTATGTANTLNGESGLQYNGTSLAVTGQVTASGAIISTANGAMYFRGGDDAEFWDINVANTVGIYGQQNSGSAGIKLGSSGPTLFGSASRFGIGTTTPTLGTLEVNGNVWANSFTGSLFGTASWANNATNATNVGITNNTSTAADYFITFVGSQSGNNALNVDDARLSYRPSTNTLTVDNLAGNASTATTAATASFVTGSNVFGPFGSNSITSASFAVSSSRAVSASFATSASYAVTASYALTAGSVTGGITGTGTTNYVSKFTGTSTLGNSLIYDNGTNVGIGTTSPSYKTDIVGNLRFTTGYLNSNDYFEKVFANGITFPNGTANLAADIRLGNLAFWGYIEVEITSTFGNQNSSGKLTKIFAVGTVANNNIYTNSSRVVDALGTISSNIAIGDMAWDATNTTYIIPISHIVSSGNNYTVRVRMFTDNQGAKPVFDAITLSSTYTLTALSQQYPYYNDRLGIGKSTPSTILDVSGSTTITGSLSVKGSEYISGSLYVTSSGATIGQFVGTQNGYAEFSVRNTSTGVSASGDIAVYANDGTPTNNYIDMGINNSGLTSSFYYGGLELGDAHDAYLFNVGGNLKVGNGTSTSPSQSLYLFSNPTGTPDLTITGSKVGIGTTTPSFKLDVLGSDASINGVRVGRGGGNLTTNTVVGSGSLASNTSGQYNVGVGTDTLKISTGGYNNTAVGYGALYTTAGSSNTALGFYAGYSNNGSNNILIGCGLDGKPDSTSFTGYNTLSIGKDSSDTTGLPHIWAPDATVIGSGDNDPILTIDPSVYSAFFLEYVLDDTSGTLRSGTIKGVFKSDMSNIQWTEVDVLTIGSLSLATFSVVDNGSYKLEVKLNNQTGGTLYVNYTSRLLLRQL